MELEKSTQYYKDRYKKRILISVLLLVLILLMAGCICDHEWLAATCAAPKTCQLCGETEGDTLSHTWQDATCSFAKTCTVCQATEGEPLGHSYSKEEILIVATCTQAGEKIYICARCDHSTNESIAAIGHKWEGATCINAGVCTKCGATGSKTNHNYTTTTLREFKNNFAGQRVIKCNDCNKEITEYFTDSHTFDLSAIAEEISAYAEQKGFRPIIEVFSDYEKMSSFSIMDTIISGYGPSKLVNSAKADIDNLYNRLTAYGDLGKRNLHIHVYYTQSGAIGCGYFGVYTKTSLYD